jgi:hypothetical protein
MSAANQLPGMTVAEFLAWDPPDHGNRWELIDGIPHAMAPAAPRHGLIQAEAARLIGNHLAVTRGACRVIIEIPPLPEWYERVVVTRDTTDGPVQTETERHPHPIAEAIRWQIREGEVIQAIGMARGANRTAANPVEVLVMTDVVLPFDVEPMEAADLDPRPTELMYSGNVPLLPRLSVTSSLAPAKSPASHGATSPAWLIRRLGLLTDLDRLPSVR